MPSVPAKPQRNKKATKLEIARQALERYSSFETKKSIHINLTKTTHTDFRKFLFDNDLSMQEVFEWFAHLAASYDDRAIAIIKEAKSNKRAKILSGIKENALANVELENIYEVLSEIDPLSDY